MITNYKNIKPSFACVFVQNGNSCIPYFQVAHFGIANPKDLADAENSYRATLAQILGGVAIGIGIYLDFVTFPFHIYH
jgi:hypothetical protein